MGYHPNQVLEEQNFVHMNKTLLGMVFFNAETVFSLLTNHSKHECHNSHKRFELMVVNRQLAIVCAIGEQYS